MGDVQYKLSLPNNVKVYMQPIIVYKVVNSVVGKKNKSRYIKFLKYKTSVNIFDKLSTSVLHHLLWYWLAV